MTKENDVNNSNNIDLSSKDVKVAILKAVEEATIGLRKNRDDILDEKKILSESLKKFEGIDPDKMREVMININKSEETKLIASGKLEEVWSLRSKAMRNNYDNELKNRDTKINDLTDNASSLKKRLEELSIDTVIRDASLKHKIRHTAVSDAILQGRSLFSMSNDGNLVIVDKNGFVRPGSDGKTPMQPEEWLQGLKESKPHWWNQSNGAGATGGAGGSGDNKSLTRDQFDKMSQGDKNTFVSDGGYIN